MTDSQFKNHFNPIQDLLFGFAMRLTKNRNDAEDLIQETTCLALEKIHRFRIGTNFKSWMTTIMYNTFVNGYRKKKTRNKIMVNQGTHGTIIGERAAPEKTTSRLAAQELQTVIMSLSEDFRQPFMMHYKGFKYEEIAEKMDLKIGTVKSRIFFARKKMQKMINEMNHIPTQR